MEKTETYFEVFMKTKEYKQKSGYTGFVFTGRENSGSYTLGKENLWLKTGQFTFVDYIYVQDDPVGIILLRRQSEDESEKEHRIYCGIEQHIDVWDYFINDEGCLEEYCIQYIFYLEMTESYKNRENAENIFYRIAKHYHEMQCEENQKEQAVFWYGMAAEQGNARLMYELGCLHCFEGKHVYPPWNPADGVPWLEKAYENGIKKAAKALAEFLIGRSWKYTKSYMNHKKCLYYLREIAKEDTWAQEEIKKISLEYKNKKTSDKNRLTDEMRKILKGKSLDEQQE